MELLRGRLAALSVAALALFGCPSQQTEEPPTREPWRDPPRVTAALERGVVTATGLHKEDTLTVWADRAGSVKVVVGTDCAGAQLVSGAVPERQDVQFTLRAEGALSEEKQHVLSACFTGTDQSEGRSAVVLEVDNTPPSVTITPASGQGHCRPPSVSFLCSGCATIAYGLTSDVDFGANGEVTSGTRYQGFAVPVPLDTTVYFRGIDRAGNKSELSQAIYPLVQGQISVVGLVPAVVSNNFNSTQRSTELTLQGTPSSTVQVRRNASSCSTGVVLAQGNLDSTGAATFTLYASALDSSLHGTPTDLVEHPLRICATIPAGCTVETTATLSRKDASLGWTAEAPAGTVQKLPAWPQEVSLLYADAAVNAAAASVSVSSRVESFYDINAPVDVQFEADRARLVYEVPLPENVRVDLQISPTNLRDEAGNPLPSLTTYVNTSAGTNWHPYGQKSFTATTETVTDARTGLVWERPAGSTRYWYQALLYCHQRATNGYAGRTDWRVPTVRELLSLLDHTAVAGYPTFLPADFPRTTDRFWTATGFSATTTAWAVDFQNGVLVEENRMNFREVRCVAGTINGGAPRVMERVSFDGTDWVADAAGPVVRDLASGLYWEQAPQATTYNSAGAATACDGTRHLASDWLLPSPAHFMSLHTLGTTAPRLARTEFSIVDTYYYWVSRPTGYALRPSDAAIYFRSLEPVWCVRQ